MKTFRLIICLLVLLISFNVYGQTEEIDKAKAQIATLFKENSFAYVGQTTGTTKNVFVYEDRIEVNFKKITRTFYFKDFCDFDISVRSGKIDNTNILFIRIEDFSANLRKVEKEQADNLIFIKNYYCEKRYKAELALYKAELTLFDSIAAQYRNLKTKPSLSEDQRKYIVQANGFNEQKIYQKAIEFYKKAIEVDQTSYPAAYSNLALLSAQLTEFVAAIYYMKKYLMLEPEADDSRSCQDKIYEWEIMI